MWAHCHTDKNINYGIQTTQYSEASNAHLKHLLGYTVPLPKLINILEKLLCQQIQHSQYQQYHLCGTTWQQCPILLKKQISNACETSINQQILTKSTLDLLKDVEAICNRVGHIEIKSDLVLFINQLNDKYPLLQANIEDPNTIKTKGRPNNTKCKRT
ncbi:2080_t:CDS:2, partial [Cetraspora pellucida]